MIEFFLDCSSPGPISPSTTSSRSRGNSARRLSAPDPGRRHLNTIKSQRLCSRQHPVAAKEAYQKKDIADWARSAGLSIKNAADVFPVNSVKAMRGCIFSARNGAVRPRDLRIYWVRTRTFRRTQCSPMSAARRRRSGKIPCRKSRSRRSGSAQGQHR